MGKIKDLLNQKISLSEMWQSFVLATPFSFFKKKKEETRDFGPLITYRNANVIKLCVHQDITNFKRLYENQSNGFEYNMIRKAMINQITDQLVKSDLIEWYQSCDEFGNHKLKAEIWVAQK